MSGKEQNVLAEFTLQNEQGLEGQAAEKLDKAMSRFSLVPAFLDRLKEAAEAAVNKCFGRGTGLPAARQVTVQVTTCDGQTEADFEAAGQGWGFFVVEKSSESPAGHTISLYLYQDGR